MKHRIMVVDDSRVVLAEMKKMLADTEIEIVSFCRSGEEAMTEYEKIQPELVTMDIVMPGMDGLETASIMLNRWPNAKILIVSSLAYEGTIGTAKNIGSVGFLYKPFDRDSLVAGILGALEGGTVGKS